MKKYLIGLLFFIGCMHNLCAGDDVEIFDYVASRDEIAVLSMIQEDLDAFTNLGLQVDNLNHNILDEQGRVCTIKVIRDNEYTVGAIFYTSFLQYGSNYWEVEFLVVDELHQNKGYGSFMIKSIFNEMSALTGDGASWFGPLTDVSCCRAFDEYFSVLDLVDFVMPEIISPLCFAINIGDIEYVKANGIQQNGIEVIKKKHNINNFFIISLIFY